MKDSFTLLLSIQAIVIGLAIWIGGAIFGGIQLASVQEQTQSTLQEIRQVEQELVDAELQLRHFLETHTNDVQQASEEAIANVETERARTILLVTAPVTDVQRVGQEAITMIENERDRTLQDIQTQKRRATELLNVDSLPDLSEINRQIEVLEEAGGRLDFATYAKFARTSILDISIIVITALVLSALAFILAIWPKRS